MNRWFLFLTLTVCLSTFYGCGSESTTETTANSTTERKIGVLLINHGSRSATWRNELLRLEENVKATILQSGEVKGIKTAFMEYNEPSIATRLREFDAEGFSDIIAIPVFLTVSPHTFEDIPTIAGLKEDPQAKEMLKLEKIECYKAKAKVHITPNLDFTDVLKKNVLRRVQAMTKDAAYEGLVLIGYGDEAYEKEWAELFNQVAEYVKTEVGISEHSYGWCGHLVHYAPEKTTEAINKVLAKKQKAVVVPVLVAHDENFQIKIIGGGIEKVANSKETVAYKPDAILPDPSVENWVTSIAAEFVQKIAKP